MTTTEDICRVIQTLWNENGLATENISEPLQAYWARIENCPPMNPKHSGDINQKHWDWYCGNIMAAIPPELMHFLKEHRGRTADPAGPWRAGLNAVLDRQAPPLARYVRAQALIPLLAPVIKVEHLPFFRFEKAPSNPHRWNG